MQPRLSLFRDQLYINLRIRYIFAFVSFPRRCNACNDLDIYIYIYIALFRVQRFLHLCAGTQQRMHSRIDRSRKTSLRFQYRTSPVDVTRAYACLLTSLESCLQLHLPPFRSENIAFEILRDTSRYKNENILKASIVNRAA